MGWVLEEGPEVRGRLQDIGQPDEVGHVRGERLDVGGAEMDFGGVALEVGLWE